MQPAETYYCQLWLESALTLCFLSFYFVILLRPTQGKIYKWNRKMESLFPAKSNAIISIPAEAPFGLQFPRPVRISLKFCIDELCHVSIRIMLTFACFIFAERLRAADDVPLPVTVRAIYKMANGRVQLEYMTNQVTDDELINFFDSKKLAGTFTSHVLRELNDSLKGVNPRYTF